VVVARDGVEALDYLFATDPTRPRPERPACGGAAGPQAAAHRRLECCGGYGPTSHRVVPVRDPHHLQGTAGHLRAYNLGANSYIRKPVDFEKFIHAVGQLGLYGCAQRAADSLP